MRGIHTACCQHLSMMRGPHGEIIQGSFAIYCRWCSPLQAQIGAACDKWTGCLDIKGRDLCTVHGKLEMVVAGLAASSHHHHHHTYYAVPPPATPALGFPHTSPGSFLRPSRVYRPWSFTSVQSKSPMGFLHFSQTAWCRSSCCHY